MPGTCWCLTVPLNFKKVAEITLMQVILRGIIYRHCVNKDIAYGNYLGLSWLKSAPWRVDKFIMGWA